MFSTFLTYCAVLSCVLLSTSVRASYSVDPQLTNGQNGGFKLDLDNVLQLHPFVCETGSVLKPEQVNDWLNYIKSHEAHFLKENEEIIIDDEKTEGRKCNIGDQKQYFFIKRDNLAGKLI